MLKIEEIPVECGLKECYWENNQTDINTRDRYRQQFIERNQCSEEKGFDRYPKLELVWFLATKTTIDAPLRESLPPSWTFVAALFRRMQEMERERCRRALEAAKT